MSIQEGLELRVDRGFVINDFKLAGNHAHIDKKTLNLQNTLNFFKIRACASKSFFVDARSLISQGRFWTIIFTSFKTKRQQKHIVQIEIFQSNNFDVKVRPTTSFHFQDIQLIIINFSHSFRERNRKKLFHFRGHLVSSLRSPEQFRTCPKFSS